MPFESHTQVYTVRLWRERRKRAESEDIWRGRVEQVLTGEGVYFQDMEKLVSFIIRTSGATVMEKRSLEDRAGVEEKSAQLPGEPEPQGTPSGPEKS